MDVDKIEKETCDQDTCTVITWFIDIFTKSNLTSFLTTVRLSEYSAAHKHFEIDFASLKFRTRLHVVRCRV